MLISCPPLAWQGVVLSTQYQSEIVVAKGAVWFYYWQRYERADFGRKYKMNEMYESTFVQWANIKEIVN